ncbi:Membrane associated serine protease, rhomboid family [Haladaptatus litoreus]|uniref:Membrane associated serine protease, rhomboid family n=1 Tax=Haladaptatus litoreus TaxID=553468 RepID=A0A1N6YQI4_9EURY|nr:rhomboid family intramembrane serine protease [Haladaptatus litoreus]SIR16860.1 Membrane associated serine protease, rhomboid family [Haladaptatus litoreus]
MVSPFGGWPIRVAISLGLLLSILIVWRLDRPRGAWGSALRKRFLFGVPWGTLISVIGVTAVYLFVQGGWNHWRNPVTVAFASWSYLYPKGMLLGSFSHAGPGHLIGNMTSTLALAPLAEYFFSHYPTEQGEESGSSWRTNPWIRAFVLFPLGVVVIALGTSIFAWGPVIGFSGVLYAFIGFALVQYPLGTIVALSAQGLINTLYLALREPQVIGEATSTFSRPWWFGIAVQGHTLGFFFGAVAGVYLLRRRNVQLSALRVWAGSFVLLMSLSLWALWWYRGLETYVLFRGLGVLFVLALSILVAVAVRTTDRESFGPNVRQVGTVLLLIPLLVMAGVAIPVNLTSVGSDAVSDGSGVEVDGYTVMYAENVPNQKVSVIDVSLGGETTQVNTSGVIVVNEHREIWSREVSQGQLAHSGQTTVRVGGIGWQKAVHVNREGWTATGGGTAYQVWLRPETGRWQHEFASDSVTATPVIDGKEVSIVPQNGRFSLELSENNSTVASGSLPVPNSSVTLSGVTFERTDDRLVAVVGDTRVQVAKKEQYGS